MFDALFQSAMTKVDYAGNICVIKCIPGLAQAACAAVANFVDFPSSAMAAVAAFV